MSRAGARRDLHSFPTRRSSDLMTLASADAGLAAPRCKAPQELLRFKAPLRHLATEMRDAQDIKIDRKSTRLNSSHVETSYAVFCSKKKTGWQRAKSASPGRVAQ